MTTRVRFGLFAPMVFAFASVGAHAIADGLRIAVVDTNYAIQRSEDGMRAKATLTKQMDQFQAEIRAAETDLQKKREEIDRQKGVLAAPAWQRKVELWQAEVIELQKKHAERTRTLQEKERELFVPVHNKVRDAARQLATKEGYDLLLDSMAVPYSRSDLNLTDKLIQAANGKLGAAPAPSAPAPGTSGR